MIDAKTCINDAPEQLDRAGKEVEEAFAPSPEGTATTP